MNSNSTIAVQEPARLAALQGVAWLDTPVEEAFDRLIRLARKLFRVPAALVSLVDEDRQFFQRAAGLPEPWASLREAPLFHPAGQHTFPAEQPLVVEDARLEPLLWDSQAIRDLRVIAYLGIPLLTANGHVLGSFCVIDHEPREWTHEDIALLRDLAASVMSEIELRTAVQEARARAVEAEHQHRQTALLLQSTGEGIYGVDAQMRCTFINPAAEMMLGYQPQEVLGQAMHALIHHTREDGSHYPEAECPIEASLRTGEPALLQDEILWRKDGTAFHAQYSAHPIQAEEGVQGAVVVFRDITERQAIEKALRTSEARFRGIFQGAAIGALLTNTEGRILECNHAFEQMLGYSAAELRRMVFTEFTHPEDVHRDWSLFLEVIEGKRDRLQVEKRYIRKEGGVIWVRLSSSIVRQNGDTCLVALVEDITQQKETEERLRGHLALTDAIVNGAADAIFMMDGEGCTTFLNAAAEQMFGWGREELLGKNLHDVIHYLYPDGSPFPMADCPLDCVFRTAVTLKEHEDLFIHRDGRWVPVLCSNAPVLENGAVTAAVLVVHDLTERKRAEAALCAAHDTFRNLVENSPFGIYAVDADFRLVQVSAGAQKVFENVRPLLGRDFAEVLRCIWPEPFASEAIGRFRHTLATGEPYHSPCTVERRRDIGEVESYDWKTERVTLPDGRYGVVCHFYDLSERQQYEEALREADRRKDEFLAMLGHELRNPLAGISNATHVLNQIATDNPQVERLRAVIGRQTRNLSRLVDDLLDVARVSQGRIELHLQQVDLGAVVQRVAETARPLLEQKQLGFTVALPPEPVLLQADPVRLEQVVVNLLNNAAKYTDVGGHIALAMETDGAEAVLSVRDTGIGMSADLLPRVFDLFVQSERSLDRSHGGLGIGLTLVRQLVEMHGGTVQAFSEGPGKGSEFVVRLSRQTGAQPTPGAAEARATASHRMGAAGCSLRVLIVDDNRDAAETLVELLELWGYAAEVAYDGCTALRVARDYRPDVVLLDIGLPGMDGYAVAAALRRDSAAATPCLVAVTGYGQEQDHVRSQGAGFHYHLVKPVDAPELERILALSAGRLIDGR